jgi:uncharacterized protein (DUF488 family)
MLYSVGHSTLDIPSFIGTIKDVDVVMDIRSHPTSKWPQFRKEEMERWLPEHGKSYEWRPALGGWRDVHLSLRDKFISKLDIEPYTRGKFPKQIIAADAAGGGVSWTNRGLYDYSWFMTLPEFIESANQLIERSRTENIGILCCEALYYKCHRSMVADYVVFNHCDVIHLQPRFRQKNKVKFVDGYKQILHSNVIGNRIDRYDPEIRNIWSAIDN